jgi:hypothetical protein
LLGDSQTFGNGVAQEQTFAARLESLLRSRMPGRAIDVINAGIAGYDSVQEVKLLERVAPSLKPDIVVVGFYLNDIVEVLQPKKPIRDRRGIWRISENRFVKAIHAVPADLLTKAQSCSYLFVLELFGSALEC